MKKNNFRSVIKNIPTMGKFLIFTIGLSIVGIGNATVIVNDFDLTVETGGNQVIDVNKDGINDLVFYVEEDRAWVEGIFGTQISGYSEYGNPYAMKFGGGAFINDTFFNGSNGKSNTNLQLYILSEEMEDNGPWAEKGDHGYLGLRFGENADRGIGWLELTRGSLTIGAGGFQTSGNTPILIPSATVAEPGTTALLAVGILGLLGFRYRTHE